MDFEIFEDIKTPKGKIIIEEDDEQTNTEEKQEEKQEEFKNTHTVIDMSKEPIKNDNSWMIKDVPYTEPTEYEKKLLEGTITAKELLEKEKEEEQNKKEKTPEEKLEEYKQDFINKVKVLALYKCKFYPLSNPSTFTKIDKQRVIDKMGKIIKNYTDDELTEEFNKIICDILTDPKTKYENLPIKTC